MPHRRHGMGQPKNKSPMNSVISVATVGARVAGFVQGLSGLAFGPTAMSLRAWPGRAGRPIGAEAAGFLRYHAADYRQDGKASLALAACALTDAAGPRAGFVVSERFLPGRTR